MSSFIRFLNIYVENSFLIINIWIFTLQKREDRRKEISSLKEKEEWYYRQDGKRIRYQFCSDCDYKSTKRVHLEKHVKTMHPNSNTALPPAPQKRGQTLYQCTLCQCKTPSKQYFDDHLMHHRKKFAHRCHLCSYTSKGRAWLDRHLKNHHHRRVSKLFLYTIFVQDLNILIYRRNLDRKISHFFNVPSASTPLVTLQI